jgi:hypothetical protein
VVDAVNRFALAVTVAVLTIVSDLSGGSAQARTLSISPSDGNLFFRRYRGDDEVSDHDRGRGRGRRGSDSEEDSGHGKSGGSDGSNRGPSSPGKNGDLGKSDSYIDDTDDRFSK